MRHPLAWAVWAVGLAAAALLTRNPLYLTLLALAAWLVLSAVSGNATQDTGWRGLLKVGALVWAVTIPFNALMIHAGDHVLFRLPESWPLLGGAITLEAALYGAASGLAVWTLLVIFAAFNLAADASRLLRLAPAFLYPHGGGGLHRADLWCPSCCAVPARFARRSRFAAIAFAAGAICCRCSCRCSPPRWSGPSNWPNRWRRAALAAN